MAKYARIDLRTIEGFNRAEELQSIGYKIVACGINSIDMIKE